MKRISTDANIAKCDAFNREVLITLPKSVTGVTSKVTTHLFPFDATWNQSKVTIIIVANL